MHEDNVSDSLTTDLDAGGCEKITGREINLMDTLLLIYLFAVNVLAFILYGLDKKRARRGEWRIREKTLIGIALLGGSIGAISGMHFFHHKTRHWYFRFGLPLILIIQILLIFFLYTKVNDRLIF